MKSIRKDLFILIIGHGRSGTSAVTGFLNSFPGINIGFEKNLSRLKKIKELKSSFKMPYIFNGNKIVFNGKMVEFEDIMYCLNKKTGFIHDKFEKLKVIFINRCIVDNICSQYVRLDKMTRKNRHLTINDIFEKWIYEHNTINRLKKYFSKNYFNFDFYEFITEKHIQEELLDWIGINFSEENFGKKLNCGIYGERFLDLNLSKCGPNYRKKNLEERLEIEKLLCGKFGRDWKNEIGKIFE